MKKKDQKIRFQMTVVKFKKKFKNINESLYIKLKKSNGVKWNEMKQNVIAKKFDCNIWYGDNLLYWYLLKLKN